MNNIRNKFGINFRQIRRSKNLNQDHVAERAGLSDSYISGVERGVANPKLDTIAALADGVGVSPMELFNFHPRNFTASEIKAKLLEAIVLLDDETLELAYQKLLNSFAGSD